jgi:hypothetical protein
VQAGSGGGGGGGGGGGFTAGTAGDAGGNGGGGINLDALGNLSVSGIITANGSSGGNGGNGGVRSGNAANWNCESCSNGDGGGANDCRDASQCSECTYYTWVWPGGAGGGAGGGSGGGIKLQSEGIMTITGNLQANGGNGGNAGHPWQSDAPCNAYAGAGAAGAGGVIKYEYNPCANNVFTPSALSVIAGTTGNGTDGNAGANTAGNGVIFNQLADIYYPGYAPFNAPSISSNQSVCPGGRLQNINSTSVSGGTGSYNYQWYYSTANPNGQVGTSGTPAANWYSLPNDVLPTLSADSISSISTTTYYQLLVQSGPCYVWSNVVTVAVQPSPSVAHVAATNATCSYDTNGTITITPSGGTPGYTYSADSGVTYQYSNVFNNLSAGPYYVFVRDTNSCTGTYADNAVVITSNPAIVQTDEVTNATCIGLHNGAIHVTASGGTSPYYYSLNGGGSQSASAFSNMAGAIYYVRVLDSKGCYNTQMVTVMDSEQLNTIVDSVKEVTCFGLSNGTISLATTGGTPPYLYSLNNGTYVAASAYTALAAGDYTVKLHDNRGCTDQYDFTILQPDLLILKTDTVINGTCSAGSILVSIGGGTEPYHFIWSNSDTARNLYNLATGHYTLSATDANGCSASLSDSVVSNAVFSAITSSTASSCFNQPEGSAQISVTGNTGPFSYAWDNGGSDSAITNVAAGNYTVTVNDINNCTQAFSVEVTEPGQIQTAFDIVSPDCSGGKNGAAGVTVTGGTPPYFYSWSNNGGTDSITQLSAGIYTLTITDSVQCSIVASVAISQPEPISISVSVTTASAGSANGSATIDSIAGGVAPYNIQWSSGQSGNTAANLPAGLDTVVVIDHNGCTKTQVVVIDITGISSVGSNNFAIYPNPTTSVLNIDIYQTKQESTINFKNVLGQTVLTRNTIAGHNEIDVSELAGGVYLVEVIQGSQKAVRQVVVSR